MTPHTPAPADERSPIEGLAPWLRRYATSLEGPGSRSQEFDPGSRFRRWAAAIEALATPKADVDHSYGQLLYAVARKFPGESRHETALRYIREAEARATEPGQAKSAAPVPPNTDPKG